MLWFRAPQKVYFKKGCMPVALDELGTVMGKKKASALLKDASFVDEYRGKQIPQGKKSVTIRLTIGSDEKTLTSQEIESVAEQVMKKLGKKMGAELRTQ